MRLPPLSYLQLLFPLLLVESLHRAGAKPTCPTQQPCQCTDLRIKCVQQDRPQLNYISRIPYFSPSNYETRSWTYSFHEMRVRDQALTNLSLQFAWGVLNLRKIEVTNSLVRRISPNVFKGIIGVQSLNLSNNLLSSLSSNDLAELTQLRELILHDNQIRVVYQGAFQHTPFVAQLYLSHNRLSEIPEDIRHLSSLTHLYLQFNNISTVRDYAFAGLRKLIVLDLGTLRRNLLIQPRAFCGLGGGGGSYGEEALGGSDAYTDTDSTSSLESIMPMSLMSRDRGLAALYLRHNVLHDLNLCALGKITSLRALNLTGSIFPCSCQAASLANQSTWQADYGFSPRYVTYEPWQVANCDSNEQRCSELARRRRQHCDTSARCRSQPAYPGRSRVGNGGVIRDWQFTDTRLSYRNDQMSQDSNNGASEPHLYCRLLLLCLSMLSVNLVNSISWCLIKF